LTSSTKRKTLAKAKRKPPETDIIDFGEETKNTKRLKQQASRAATDRGRGRGRSRGGGSARGRGASARRSGRGGWRLTDWNTSIVEIEVANAIFAIVVVVVVTGPSLCALWEKVIYIIV
jgi:hypothetical protein